MKAHPARAGRAVKPRTRKAVREAQGCRSSDRCETGLLGADAALLIGGWLTQAQKSSRMAAARHCRSCRLQRQGCCCSLGEPQRKNRSDAVLCLHEFFSEHSCSGLITAISAGGLIISVWELIASENHSSRSKFDHGT